MSCVPRLLLVLLWLAPIGAAGDLCAQGLGTPGFPPVPDTTHSRDTIAQTKSRSDSLRVAGRGPGADSMVTYSYRDSARMSIDRQVLRLYGDAEVTRGAMRLTAAFIEIDFRTSELLARAIFDSSAGRYIGEPVFKDATQDFSALSMRYNFKTGKGITEAAETKFEEGFYYGEKIKRVSANTLFIQNGVYTTCDAPHPHYFFKSDRMKVVVGDRVFADQPTLNVADVPIFWIPIGVFFARSGGKQSGIIIPTWSQNSQRGFTIEGLGYFWAGNEYVDARLNANLYSKGGFTLEGIGRFRLRGIIEQSDLDYTFGRTRDDPDIPLSNSHILRYDHRQQIGRRSQLGGTLRYSTQNAIRRTTTSTERFDRLNDITTRSLESNFSYSTSWPWGGSFSTQYSRRQDVITSEMTQSGNASFAIPTLTPFAAAGAEPGLFSNLALSYRTQATWLEEQRDTLPGGGFALHTTQRGVRHNPSISLALPRIGYFNISPSVNLQGGWFFRKTVKETVGDTVIAHLEPGFHQAWTGSAGLSLTTTLYGIVQPRILGVNALRHVLQPTINFSYQPDFGRPSWGYYDSVYNPRTARTEAYSLFEADRSVAPIPYAGRVAAFNIGLQNTFEAKIARGDTLEDLRVRLLTLNINASYNAAADSLRWSAVGLTAGTSLGTIGSLNANATFDPYAVDTLGTRTNEFLRDRGLGLFRVTQAGVSVTVNFSNQGLGTTVSTPRVADSVQARRERFTFEPIAFDEEEFFGERVRGAGDYSIPWDFGLTATYSQSRGYRNVLNRNAGIELRFGLQLTPSTRITSSVSYDFVLQQIAIPTVSFYRDLHCWEMQFDWRPTGFSRGFYFKLGIKSPQLRDIKLERERTFFE